jgi:sugar phosphate isomerase/epimerase
MFQNIWEETNEEQGQASLLTIKRHLKYCEDINMGWVNVHWGVPQDLNVITSLP